MKNTMLLGEVKGKIRIVFREDSKKKVLKDVFCLSGPFFFFPLRLTPDILAGPDGGYNRSRVPP